MTSPFGRSLGGFQSKTTLFFGKESAWLTAAHGKVLVPLILYQVPILSCVSGSTAAIRNPLNRGPAN